jgi:hypothetical protein
MRGAAALELQYAGSSGPVGTVPSGRAGIEPIEGPIEQRRVEPARAVDSRIAFFLDGAQRTLSHSRVGLAPVTAVVAAAGVVERDACAECRPAPGSTRLKHVWLIPGLDDPHLARFRDAVLAAGMEVRDPLASAPDGPEEGERVADYTTLQELAYEAAKNVRQEMEAAILGWFRTDPRYAPIPAGSSWTAVCSSRSRGQSGSSNSSPTATSPVRTPRRCFRCRPAAVRRPSCRGTGDGAVPAPRTGRSGTCASGRPRGSMPATP